MEYFPPVVAPILLALTALMPAARASDATRAAGIALPKPAPPSDWRPVVTGHLQNGVRFAILPRRGSEPGLGLLMRNEGGFIAERRPGERGLAHLIEHLVLVSPTNEAPDELRHFVRIGLPLTFPAPSAGTTSWRETNYFLSTRTTDMADLDTLLALYREAATELTFRADAVDDQRADVMREMAGRKLGNDIYAAYIAAVAPGSPNDVIDAQNSEDVPVASIETIRGLYHRLYRPETMMIVVVGNVDAAQAKALIEKHFGGWRRNETASVRAEAPVFHADRIKPISFSALRQGRRTAMMTVVMPMPSPPPPRSRQVATMLMDMLVVRAVNERLVRAQPDAPPGKIGIVIENGEQGHRQIMLWDNFSADRWQPAVAGLSRVTCDLGSTGFSEQEWNLAKRNVIHDLERRSLEMAKVTNVELAKDLSHALAAGRALIPPNQLLQNARTVLPAITTKSANAWWRRQWRADIEHIRVEAPELAQVKDPAAIIRTTADDAVEATTCKVRR